MRRDGPSPAREKKGRAGGGLFAGLGQGGTMARPLDGGVLTRRGARAPARGPATAPWLAAPPRSLARLSSPRLREEWRAAKRERAAKKEWVRVWRARPRAGFCSPYPRARPSDHTDDADSPGRPFSPGGCARQAEFPAQAQVAAWARGSTWTAVGRAE